MKYSQTYAAVIVALLGWFNLGTFATNEEIGGIIDSLATLIGLIVVLVKRYQAGGVTPLGVRK